MPTTMQRLSLAFLTWRRFLQKRIAPYNITLKQAFVLRQLAKTEFMYPSKIAVLLFCDRPTATVILKNMERQGWISRERDPQNRKYTRIRITERGREKQTEIEQGNTFQTVDPLACFDAQEGQELDRLLAKLNKHIRAIEKENQK